MDDLAGLLRLVGGLSPCLIDIAAVGKKKKKLDRQ